MKNNYIYNNHKFRFYLLVGDLETWKISLKNNLWGFKESTKGLWNTLKEGECVGLYVTIPIKRIIGFGKIIEKFVDEEIIWPDEKFLNKSIWKYKIKLEFIYVIDNWDKGIEVPSMNLNTGRKVITENIFIKLIQKADKKWKSNIQSKIYQSNLNK